MVESVRQPLAFQGARFLVQLKASELLLVGGNSYSLFPIPD